MKSRGAPRKPHRLRPLSKKPQTKRTSDMGALCVGQKGRDTHTHTHTYTHTHTLIYTDRQTFTTHIHTSSHAKATVFRALSVMAILCVYSP